MQRISLLTLSFVAAAATVFVRCAASKSALSPVDTEADGAIATTPAAAAPAARGPGVASYCARCQMSAGPPPKVALSEESELSGIAASAVHDGVFYVHNDSGDTARFFAIDAAGNLLGTFGVSNATALDWEDIAVGPCDSGSCIFLADTGDNHSRRSSYTVYRVPEPTARPNGGGTSTVTGAPLTFHYPDGSHDAEALLVQPATGRLSLVTKSDGPSSLYLFPEKLTPGVTMTLTFAHSFSLPSGSPRVTAGSFAPNGHGILLRTYSSLWFFRGTDGEDAATILRTTPCVAPSVLEAQGEAVTWLRSGLGYVTVSEGRPLLHFAHCSSVP